mmetsp:Transcript_36503/g.87034  ORF Transcript_36503/g.87034 Transcript_36503/m.87034 type:complete len:517 (-) Transcript_36503:83-1633(-)
MTPAAILILFVLSLDCIFALVVSTKLRARGRDNVQMSPFTSQAVATRPLRLDESDSSGRLSPANLSADRSFAAKNIPWLIVGGGIHGVHISARLIGSGVVSSASDLCIVDNNEALLHLWKLRTRNTGMGFLRSSSGYHLDIPDDALRKFSNDNSGRNKTRETNKRRGTFSKDYERPQLDFFNDHCDHVVSKYHLDQIHTKGKVKKIDPSNDRFVAVQVEKVDGGVEWYHAANVVLALGNDLPRYPDWVDIDYDVQHGFVRHLLDGNDFCTGSPQSTAIVGGGITVAHKSLELGCGNAGEDMPSKSRAVHVISRHPFKEQQFDTHQEWMMDQAAAKRSIDGGGAGLPDRQVKFLDCSDYEIRRKTIARERIPGTVTTAVFRGKGGLKYAIEEGRVQFHQSEIVAKAYVDAQEGEGLSRQKLQLKLSNGESITVDQVLLGTGFGTKIPGGMLMEELSKELPTSEYCGFPIVDKNLRWGRNGRIFVSGALAELEVGPSARNIAGARLAAERIVEAFTGS